jgi:hypothetical protein
MSALLPKHRSEITECPLSANSRHRQAARGESPKLSRDSIFRRGAWRFGLQINDEATNAHSEPKCVMSGVDNSVLEGEKRFLSSSDTEADLYRFVLNLK